MSCHFITILTRVLRHIVEGRFFLFCLSFGIWYIVFGLWGFFSFFK